jgi:hypothetical protein
MDQPSVTSGQLSHEHGRTDPDRARTDSRPRLLLLRIGRAALATLGSVNFQKD